MGEINFKTKVEKNCFDKHPCHDLLEVRRLINITGVRQLTTEQQIYIIEKCSNLPCPYFDIDKLKATYVENDASLEKKLTVNLNDFLQACNCYHL